MVVLREPGEVFLLRHTGGPDAISLGRADRPEHARAARPLATCPAGRRGRAASPRTRTARCTSCSATTRTGSAPDLDACSRRASCRGAVPYNSFVVLPDGHLVTKDFGGVLPGQDPATHAPEPAELLALDPESLDDRRALRAARSRRSRASRPTATTSTSSARRRCSACAGTARALALDDVRRPLPHARRVRPTAGTRCSRSARRGSSTTARAASATRARSAAQGISTAPLHLVRVDLATGAVHAHRDLRAARTASSPTRRWSTRRAASSSAYDSGNGVLAAFDIAADGALTPRWRREQNHACHPLLFPDTGELVTNDHDATRMCRRDRRARHRDRRRARARRLRQPGAVGGVPRRRLRPRLLLLLVRARHARLAAY